MTWAPTKTQKSIYDTLSQDSELAALLGAIIPVEVQTVSADEVPDSGSFDLTVVTGVVLSINFDSLAADIQTALRLFTGYEAATVTGSFALGFVFTFIGLEGPQAAMVVSNNTLQEGIDPVTLLVTRTTEGSLEMEPQKVFDFVPENFESFPYVVMNILPWSDRGNRTWEGLQSEFQIDVWDRTRGTLKIQQIQKRIDELLHKANLCIDGWNIISMRRTFIDIQRDADSVTRRGIQRFQIMLGRNSYIEP